MFLIKVFTIYREISKNKLISSQVVFHGATE